MADVTAQDLRAARKRIPKSREVQFSKIRKADGQMNTDAPGVSLEQLQRVHTALRIATPLNQASPMLLSTLTVIAHCWRDRIPSNLWSDADQVIGRRAPAYPSVRQTAQQTTDLKRRAAGDID